MRSLRKSSQSIYADHELAFGRELVEFADEIIATGNAHTSSILLGELLSNAGGTAPVRFIGREQINPTSAAALFDAFTSNNLPGPRQYFNQFFEIVASPRSRIASGSIHN